ncbi:MAG: glycosyltransferase family 4 protein [bacterium]|nr:glycosyltransferase family 4 protein [bacterium]
MSRTASNIILLSQFFYPESAATSQLLTDLAMDLRERGFSVLVYAGQPTYHGSQRLVGSEEHRGVQIRRLFSTQFRKSFLLGRTLNWITFSASVAMRLIFGRDHGSVVATTNPPFLPWVAWLGNVTRRRRYAIIVHDLYPDVAVKLAYIREGNPLTRVWRLLNGMAFRRAGAVIVLGSSVREEVFKQAGKRCLPVHIIHNWADGTHIFPRAKRDNWFARDHGLEGRIVVLYSGNLGLAHDLETLIEAADRLRVFPKLVLVFIGEGGKKAELMALAQQRGLTNVLFLPHVPYVVLSYSLAVGDIGVVTLQKGLEGLSEPSKLYGYLAAGLAILGLVGERSEVAQIIQRHGCGYRVDQGDVTGTVSALIRWMERPAEMQEMKERARRCFEENYEKKRVLDKYARVLWRL